MNVHSWRGVLRPVVVATMTIAATVAVTSPASAGPSAPSGSSTLKARTDVYLARSGQTVTPYLPVTLNDTGRARTVVSSTQPGHGTVTVRPNGTLSYTSAAGFVGLDSFTYTITDAVELYPTAVPPLGTVGGVTITGGAYGSALTPVPGRPGQYYGLTDRGPNVDGPNGEKVEPLPDFTPAIGRFRLVGGKAVLLQTVPLEAADGTPYNGQVNTQANTGETIVDLNGQTLPASPDGYDPEGLVALADGSFWVSDEYGPFITHFSADGRALSRLSPFDGSLPPELANRLANRGMEGLTITPDGSTLVGIMQSALNQPDLGPKPKNISPVRIVTYDLATGATHEYLYLLDNPETTGTAVSEITALSATTFLVDERDGNLEPGANKKVYEVDLAGATDVGPAAAVPGATYDPAQGGLLVGGKTIEAYVGKAPTATAQAVLAAAGITVGAKTTYVDLGGLLTGLDPTGGFFGHDKVEGVATPDGGTTLVISNDSDFGISGVTTATPPFTLTPKLLPNGTQDDGELLVVHTDRLPAVTSTATVYVLVLPGR